jgi:predicted outer membrane protein
MLDILHTAIDKVERSRAEIARLSKAQPEGWKSEYAKLRLRIQDEIGELERLAQRYTDGGELHEMVKTALARVKHHQARWPVMLIKSKNEEYDASVHAMNELFSQIARYIKSKT